MALRFRRRDLASLAGAVLLLALGGVACADGGSGGSGPGANPTPVLLRATPSLVVGGAQQASVELTGEGFVPNSRVRLNGGDRATTYTSDTRLGLALTAEDLAQVGQVSLVVYNPPPAGGTSGLLTLTIGYPVPAITALTPAGANVGAAETTITVTGTGFVSNSFVRWNGNYLQTTYVSATSLRALVPGNLLSNGGTAKISVVNPAPGGGASPTADFGVSSLAPTISSLSPNPALIGATFTLTVFGSNFGTSSVVRWNGADRPTTFWTSGKLTAQITNTDVATAGTASVTVFTPAPGGGTSAAVSLPVREAPPRISSLSPGSATAGTSDFTLTVNGSDFVLGSQVQWNGQSRATTVVSNSVLQITVPAADVAVSGTAQVTVVNPGATGGTSTPQAFPILPSGSSTITSQVVVSIKNNHVVYDATRDLVYASVPSSVPTYGNGIVAIEPATGNVRWSVAVGSEPGRMALSDDGRWLYVIMNGAPSVVRVDLGLRAKDIEFLLGQGTFGSLYGEDIVAIPGAPRSVAVSRRNQCCSPRHEGVAIYDDGVMRPSTTQGHTGSDRITASATGAQLYGYNNETTEFGFRRISVSSTGLAEETVRGGLIGGFGVDIEYDAGRIYATSGAVVDPEQMTRIGTFPTNGIVRPDAANGRVHFFSGTTLTTVHYTAFTLIGTLTIDAAAGSTSFVRVGTDGLAFGGGDRVVLIRSGAIGT